MSRLVSIGEAARVLGVSLKTLRRYEDRGLVKPIRTMGGQRRYYLSALREVLATAAEEQSESTAEDDAPANTSAASSARPREPSVWDEVEKEKASFEALRIRGQRAVFVRSQQEEVEQNKKAREAQHEAERRELQLRTERELAAVERQRQQSAHESNLRYALSLSEFTIGSQPKEAEGTIRKSLLRLVTPEQIPIGTPLHQILQLIQSEINTVSEPFLKVRRLKADGLAYAEHELASEGIGFTDRRRLCERIDSELAARLTADWTPYKVQRLIDNLIDAEIEDVPE